jgi:hyperosmotically inducible protein
MLPYYGVFDNITYAVDSKTNIVTLDGQVRLPTLKTQAGNAAKSVAGVEQVKNNIEVLPTSPNDDRLRLALYRAIYGHNALNRYQIMAVPPIHIIVKNGDVTLTGWVNSAVDKQVAEAQARSVSGTFNVKNNIQVEGTGD